MNPLAIGASVQTSSPRRPSTVGGVTTRTARIDLAFLQRALGLVGLIDEFRHLGAAGAGAGPLCADAVPCRSEIAHSSAAARERECMLPLDTRFGRKVGHSFDDSGSVQGMRAIVLDDRVTVQESRPAPNPGDGEVLVRVTCAGICETDLQLIKGYMGFRGVLGHEFVGVAESGPMAGRRVVGEINCACWTCETCRMGLHTHCPNRTVLGILNHDGAFADLIAVPQRNLHAVPDCAVRRDRGLHRAGRGRISDPRPDLDRREGPRHRPWRRASWQSLRAGARAAVESRAGRRQASAEARTLEDARHLDGVGVGSHRRALGGYRRGLHRIGDRSSDGARSSCGRAERSC